METLLQVLGVVCFCVGAAWVTAVALHTKKPRWATGATRSQDVSTKIRRVQ